MLVSVLPLSHAVLLQYAEERFAFYAYSTPKAKSTAQFTSSLTFQHVVMFSTEQTLPEYHQISSERLLMLRNASLSWVTIISTVTKQWTGNSLLSTGQVIVL